MTRQLSTVALSAGALLIGACGGGDESSTAPSAGAPATSGSEVATNTEKTTTAKGGTKPVTVAFLEDQIEFGSGRPVRVHCPPKPPAGEGESIECDAKLFVQAGDLSAKPKQGTATITQTDATGRAFRYTVDVGGRRFGDTITYSP